MIDGQQFMPKLEEFIATSSSEGKITMRKQLLDEIIKGIDKIGSMVLLQGGTTSDVTQKCYVFTRPGKEGNNLWIQYEYDILAEPLLKDTAYTLEYYTHYGMIGCIVFLCKLYL